MTLLFSILWVTNDKVNYGSYGGYISMFLVILDCWNMLKFVVCIIIIMKVKMWVTIVECE